MAKVLYPGGRRRHKTVRPQNGTDFTLGELYHIIGCGLVECVSLGTNPVTGKDEVMLLDGEGKLKGLPNNMQATLLAHRRGVLLDDVVCGTAVVCESGQFL